MDNKNVPNLTVAVTQFEKKFQITGSKAFYEIVEWWGGALRKERERETGRRALCCSNNVETSPRSMPPPSSLKIFQRRCYGNSCWTAKYSSLTTAPS